MLLNEIIEKAKQLSSEEQLRLRNILDELVSPTDPDFDHHWLAIVNKRRTKQPQTVSLEHVLLELNDQI
jgi:hypothetical protein